jgi:succinyl-CoA synthetase beta subunit
MISSPQEVRDVAGKMIGYSLITKQTPPSGVPVSSVMLAESIDFEKEIYFAILLDRAAGGPVIVASPMGGMDIEAVAESHPEAIYKVRSSRQKSSLGFHPVEICELPTT